MQTATLGRTGIVIPRLFLGTGSWDFKSGCAQAKIPPEKYAATLKEAYDAGIFFWDTSDDYHTHGHVRLGMAGLPREKLIIATKTYALTPSEALRSLQNSLNELGVSWVEIFYLHSVDSTEGYDKRISEVLPALQKEKASGRIKAVGLSTHTIHVLEKAVDEPGLDVIFTNFNKFEVHMDASLEWYSRCLERGHENGKGVLVMKTVGEGELGDRASETIQYSLSRPFIHGVCVGIVSGRDLREAISAASTAESMGPGLRENSRENKR